MAKVFLVHGAGQRGASVAELPWRKCVELFDLDDMSRAEDRPRFGDREKASIFPTRMVIQIEDGEARELNRQPGFFVSPLPVEKARSRLNDFLTGHKIATGGS
jgi:hypothetical protein